MRPVDPAVFVADSGLEGCRHAKPKSRRQVLRFDHVAATQYKGVFDDVFQFADISRIIVRHQGDGRLVAEAADGLVRRVGGGLEPVAQHRQLRIEPRQESPVGIANR